MAEEPGPVPEEPPAPRRDSWSLRTIVQEVSGHSLEEYQDPGRTPHPYLRVKPPRGATAAGERDPSEEQERPDPVAHFYPPLVGAVGRRTHGPLEEHHAETLAHLARLGGESSPGRASSPGRRPERVYLHYLLLHLDRLSDHALIYLERAVAEEREHRARSPSGPPRPSAERTPP